ncbi:FAD/NAD(P)-binding domain-containing protein [Pararhodobacter sp. SW119]|uniref:FAD/NAD(P)-binding protein n=1 Tax=Pararhodobacter sp. SW119 TaxID=2780075 RepID=UPI001ADF15F3|nr:FAD/NAD(P)-binding domain-containing protein [Pararhodobacter sp. SW119]
MASPPPPVRSVAIVGAGPRGLGALEALGARALRQGRKLDLHVFEASETPGAGPNFAPDMPLSDLLNLPVRSIDLPAPGSPALDFPSFRAWIVQRSLSLGLDDYPPRAVMGTYLSERWDHVCAVLGVTVRKARIEVMESGPDGWHLLTDAGTQFGPWSEVALVLGQPATRLDPQRARWQAHAQRHGLNLLPVYPSADLSRAARAWTGRTVAIRGLGLSTFDALRAMTIAQGGRFEADGYHPSGKEPSLIAPFSLDGRPPAPKPARGALDDHYAPRADERAQFLDALSALGADASDDLTPVATLVATIAARAMHQAGAPPGGADARSWLLAEIREAGRQERRAPLDFLEQNAEMAAGHCPPDAGYAVGQVWRWLQPDLRKGFQNLPQPGNARAALIKLDTGLKRYSYGPPLAAATELRALVAAGLVTLRATADPDIRLIPEGWTLDPAGKTKLDAAAMIDAVLPSPDLSAVTEPLIAGLVAQGVLCKSDDADGAVTDRSARAISAAAKPVEGLSILGRLSIGSNIAVDSIHDCFGTVTAAWADRVLQT